MDFRTGDLINSTSKFAISSGGTLSIGIQPTLDNTITDILGRKSDGTVVRIAKSAITITDTFTTGFTYNNANTLTLSNNTGGTLTASINVMTGLTINGQLTADTINATTSILPTQDITVNIGTPTNRFREVNTYSGTTTIWSATTIVYSPTLDLGLDSLGNSRILTANTSILNNDVLLGGSY